MVVALKKMKDINNVDLASFEAFMAVIFQDEAFEVVTPQSSFYM
jgi:hypothetical protein